MSITEFLLARIAEDEEVAKEAALASGGVGLGAERIANGKSWAHRYHEVVRPVVPDVSDRRTLADCGGFAGLAVAPHIARHDPARVLAECEAKRRIVEAYMDAEHAMAGYDDNNPNNPPSYWQEGGNRHALAETVEVLAAVYADHPDYRDEWRP